MNAQSRLNVVSSQCGLTNEDSYHFEKYFQSSAHALTIRLDGLRILLADDSDDNQKLFQRILSASGASVDLAHNGLVAIELAKRNVRYDAIIMDIRMPICDGFEATRVIRDNGYNGPIIALTAHANSSEREKCFENGCSHFFSKPIGRLKLLDAVKAAVLKFEESV